MTPEQAGGQAFLRLLEHGTLGDLKRTLPLQTSETVTRALITSELERRMPGAHVGLWQERHRIIRSEMLRRQASVNANKREES